MSWSGRRARQTVRCSLDRASGNEEWHTLFLSSYVEYLGMVGSDHRPIVTNLVEKQIKRRRQFHFDKRCIGEVDLIDSISKL